MKIFVVEDEKRVRNGLIHIISQLNPNYQIVGEAEDGEQGYELIRQLEPDVVFTDIKMPGVNGLEMMDRFSKLKKQPVVIILTGYSNFDFAQKAISYGVKEYMLKPVTVDDIACILKRVYRELLTEESKGGLHEAGAYSAEKLLEDMLLSQHYNSALWLSYLSEHFHMNGHKNYALALLHIDKEEECKRELVTKAAIDQLKQTFSSVVTVRIEKDKKLVALLEVDEDYQSIERQLDYNVFQVIQSQHSQEMIMTIMEIEGISSIRSHVDQLKKNLKYTIVLGQEQLIVSEKITTYKYRHVKFPEKIEKEALKALYSRDLNRLQEAQTSFINYWTNQQCHPEQVIDAFVRFASSLLNAFKEVNIDIYKKANSTKSIRKLHEAYTMKELTRVLEVVVGCYVQNTNNDHKGYGMLVVKTMQYIEKNYGHPITLEEIAAHLHVTSEYLSMLFGKEVGETYTSYLKRFRIEKAKYLLLNSELKIEEVSQAIGYYNIKYFYRVFKEVAGVTPRVYANINGG